MTCSLFSNRNNGILILLQIFLIKTKTVDLLVAEGTSLLPPTIGPLHSFQTSLDLLNLSSSSQSKLRVNKVLDPFQCMQRMLHCSSPIKKQYSQPLEACT